MKEAVRAAQPGAGIETVLRDARIGLRTMTRTPSFTTAVLLSPALGIGGAAAIFSVVKAVLLQPLPYPDAGRLYYARIWWGDFSALLSPADLAALTEAGTALAQVGAFWFPDDGFTLTTPEGAEVVRGAIMTLGLPSVLGAAPQIGPGFSPEATTDEVMVSEAFWRERLGGTPDAIGRSITLDGEPAIIVGVMPPGFNVPEQPDGSVWMRAALREPPRRGPFFLRTIVRLADGVTADAAAPALTVAVDAALRERYGLNETWRYGLTSVKDVLVGEIRPTLRFLFAAVGFVWLIAVINTANLLLARGYERTHELALRAALGAGRARLARHLLTESTLYGLGGGALGIVLAFLGLDLIADSARHLVPGVAQAHVDLAVVGFALALGLGAGMLAGVVPITRLSWRLLGAELREGGRTTGPGPGRNRSRRALVTAELALSLTAATLMVKSLARLEAVDPGFRPDGLATLRLLLPEREYPDSAPDRMESFLAELEAGLLAVPGASRVAYAGALPPNRLQMRNDYTVEGSTPDARGGDGVAQWLQVSSGFFEALDIPLVRGRGFTSADRAEAPPVAVVSRSFAERHFAGADPIGKRFKSGAWSPDEPWITIVGVATDVPFDRGAWGGVEPTVYRAYLQNLTFRTPFVAVRTAGDPGAFLATARQVVMNVNPRLPLRDVASMRARMDESTAAPRFRSLLFSLLAAIALALAVTGIHGVVGYEVNRRRRETAIRRALGATGATVVTHVVASGMRLAVLGLLLGAVGALLSARALSSLLFGITPLAALATAAGVLAAAALVASAVPAARAARVDPMAVLRQD